MFVDERKARLDLVGVEELIVGCEHPLGREVLAGRNHLFDAARQGHFEFIVVVEHVDERVDRDAYEDEHEIEIEVDGEQRQNACFRNIVADVFQIDHGRDEYARRVALLLARLHGYGVRERRDNVEDEIGKHDLGHVEDDLAFHHELHGHVRALAVQVHVEYVRAIHAKRLRVEQRELAHFELLQVQARVPFEQHHLTVQIGR